MKQQETVMGKQPTFWTRPTQVDEEDEASDEAMNENQQLPPIIEVAEEEEKQDG